MQHLIERQTFKAIVVLTNWKERRFSPQIWIAAIESNYQEQGVIDGFKVFQPNRN